eukprot:33326_1
MLYWPSFSFLIITLLCQSSEGLIIRVQPSVTDCFFQDAPLATRIWGSFKVTGGGQLDINVQVNGPNKYLVYEEKEEKEGTFSFISSAAGRHEICFGNEMSSVTQKTVYFSLHIGNEMLVEGIAKKEHLTPLENALSFTSMSLQNIQDQQRYLKSRERRSRNTNESTNSRILWWSIFQAVVCICMAVLQIWYLKSFFEQKPRF